MKPLSSRAIELVAALRRAPGFRERLRGSADHRLGVLAELGEMLEPAVVPHLLGLVADGPAPVARAAADVVSRTVSPATHGDIIQMDEAWRSSGWYSSAWTSGWWALEPAAVSRFATFGDAATTILGIASFHPDGYVREAAIAQLDLLANGRELPYLLIRLNDWVPVIAERARAAVERRIAPGHGRAFLEHLPILLRLHASTRRDHREMLERVYELLRSPEERAALDWALRSGITTVRRVAFRLARNSDREDQDALLARALGDADTVIRLEAVAHLRSRPRGSTLAELLPLAIDDPYPQVRREALAVAVEQLPAQAEGWLRSALLDRNVVVREVARFFLLRRGAMTDFIAFYRERAHPDAPTRELAAAISGIGETGGPADVDVVTPYLSHRRAAVRRAAVRAVGALGLAGHAERIRDMLRDESPGVSHAARDLLRRQPSSVDAPFLLGVLRSALPLHNHLDALLVASALGKWEGLPVLISGAAAAEERVRDLARAQLLAWIVAQNRRFEQPTPRQVEEIGAAVRAHHLALGRAVTGEITASLQVWAR